MILLLGLVVLGFAFYEVYLRKDLHTDEWPQAPNPAVYALAVAIATAENSGAENNPGSLTAGDVRSEFITGQFNSAGVVNIDTLQHGIEALYTKLSRIFSGESSVYSTDMSISDFAHTYTGGENEEGWANTVAGELGVSPDTSLGEINGG